MDATTTGAIVSDYVDSVSSVLTANLPTALTLAAGLFGLVLVVKYVRKFVK